MSVGRKILLCVLVTILPTFSIQFLASPNPGRSGCVKLLRDLSTNPPRNTNILINVRLSRARYLCHDGFTLSGSEVRTCRRGVWREKEEPKCLAPRPCGRPDDIPHAKFIGVGFNFKDKLTYECDDGFTLKGPRRRRCGIDGKWSRAPKCIDKVEDSFDDVNTTACKLRKILTDTLLAHNSIDTTNTSSDPRGTAIFNKRENILDLVFVLDASTSVKKANFQLGLAFMRKLLNLIDKNSTRAFKDNLRTTFVTYATHASLNFNLGDNKVSTINKTIAAIDTFDYMGGATASADALQMVKDLVVPMMRFNGHRVLIFITDGKSNVGGPPERVARKLNRDDHFEIYATGLGMNIDRTELRRIATKRYVVHIRNHQDLDRAIDRAVNTSVDYSTCGESQFNQRGSVVGGKISKRDDCISCAQRQFKVLELVKKACQEFDFAFLGEVVLLDELDFRKQSWITCKVRVKVVIKRRKTNFAKGDFIEFKKRAGCQCPELVERRDYLIMGNKKGRSFVLDNKSFVIPWGRRRKSVNMLNDLRARVGIDPRCTSLNLKYALLKG